MATLINNAGVQHYANKMVLAENRKVGSKSLPTALNDIDLALDEMKILFDTEYGSALDMKLENTENIFSVGAGSGVDKRDEVENSFTDVELKGNTLVNLFGGGFTYTSSIIKYLNGVEVSPNATARFDYASQLKKDVKYTAIVKVDQVSEKFSIRFHTANTSGIFTQIASSNMSGAGVQVSTAGIYKVLFTPQMDSIMRPFVWNTSESTINLKVAYILILEGDWTNKTTPDYFEGIKSVGELEGNKIEVLSNGKNLLSGDFYDITTPFYSHGSALREIDKNYWKVTNNTQSSDCYIIQHIDLRKWFDYKVGEKYTISFDLLEKQGGAHFYIIQYGDEGFTNGYSGNGVLATHSLNPYTVGSRVSFTFSPLEKRNGEICLRLNASSNSNGYVKIGNIQIERGSSATSYSSEYNSDKKEILLNEPLRGLPNGVKDTIEKINGEWKIVRRCGEYRFDETSKWVGTDVRNKGHWIRVIDSDIPNFKNRGCLITTVEVFEDTVWEDQDLDRLGVWDWSGMNFYIFIPSKLSGWDVANNVDRTTISLFMKTNAINIIHELATPTIEDISPITLQAWKNGTISIDSIIPVESTHTVALNKPAQIKRNIEELTQLRNKVKSLEEQYDQIALEQAHQLELINHSFELDYI